MPKCECGTAFHLCTNCQLNHGWEYTFCTEECWKNSDKYKQTINSFNEFIGSLNGKQMEQFKQLFHYFDSDYANIFDETLKTS